MKEMFDPQNPGSYVMYVIVLLSVVALGYVVERFLAFAAARTNLKRFFPELENRIRLAKMDEAIELCRSEKGVVPKVLAVGLSHHGESKDELKRILVDEVQIEVLPRLEKNLGVLSTIAKGATLLGLLGTVVGMIQLFQVIEQKQDFDVGDLAGGLYTALGTTAAGLMVAIPIVFSHAYFRGKIRGIETDLYKHLTLFLRLLGRRKELA